MKKVLLLLLKVIGKIKVFKSSCCSCECKTREECECDLPENTTKI